MRSHLSRMILRYVATWGMSCKVRASWTKRLNSYRRALLLKPDYPEIHNNLGYALQEQGKLDEAVESYHETLSLQAGFS